MKKDEAPYLWLSHYSVRPWNLPDLWENYFSKVQEILGIPVKFLDRKDPPRRKAGELSEIGDFIASQVPEPSTQWFIGSYPADKQGFTLRYSSREPHVANSISWHLPIEMARTQVDAFFQAGNDLLSPFYSFCDDVARVRTRRKQSGAVDLETELVGMFWKTYFSSTYVDFFGRERFQSLHDVTWSSQGGVEVTLASSPSAVTEEACRMATEKLGRASFVDPLDTSGKPRGKFALPYDRLK